MSGSLKILIAENEPANQEVYYEIARELQDIEIVACTDTPSKTVKAFQELEPHAILFVFSDGNSEKLVEETLRQMKGVDITHSPYIEAVAFQPDTHLYALVQQYGTGYIFPAHSFPSHWPRATIEFLRSCSDNIQRAWEASGKRRDENTAREKRIMLQIREELGALGFKRRDDLGKEYLAEAIRLNVEAPQPHLYATLGEKYQQSEATITVAMEKAISHVWNAPFADYESIDKHYKGRIDPAMGFPSITQFVDYYTEKIKRENGL